MDPGSKGPRALPLNTTRNGYHLLRLYPGEGAILKTYILTHFTFTTTYLSSQTAYFFYIHTSRKAILL